MFKHLLQDGEVAVALTVAAGDLADALTAALANALGALAWEPI